MGFKDLQIKKSYINQGSDNIVDSLLNPALKQAVSYKRSVGFFSSSVFRLLMSSLPSFIRNKGTIQLIVSPALSSDDIEAIQLGYEKKEEIVNRRFIQDFDQEIRCFDDVSLNTLSELIARGFMDIKVASVKNDIGIYHDKLGILTDKEGNTIVFYGSANSSINAYQNNYENKENFLDGIVIDKNINVIPYKFIDVTFVQIENYLKQNEKTHFLDLFSTKYLTDINQLRLGNVDSVKLPTPINAPFSQGERQVYIMSIYLALLKTSRKDIPFFIDTPFARIDSNHRDKIVREFFMSLSNQIFLLSTDEEIVGQYEGMIEGKVSNKFLLNIDTYGKTSILPEKYFEV